MKQSEELWISRAIDRRATADDWQALRRVASEDPDVWRRLAACLEAESLFAQELDGLLPGGDREPEQVPMEPAAPVATRRRYWLGMIAALLALAFGIGRWSGAAPSPAPAAGAPMTLAAMQATSPDLLMHAYLRAGASTGRVLDQLPLRTLSTQRAADGSGFDIVFVRSLIETARIEQLMTVAPNEHGQPQPLAVDLANYIPPTDY